MKSINDITHKHVKFTALALSAPAIFASIVVLYVCIALFCALDNIKHCVTLMYDEMMNLWSELL